MMQSSLNSLDFETIVINMVHTFLVSFIVLFCWIYTFLYAANYFYDSELPKTLEIFGKEYHFQPTFLKVFLPVMHPSSPGHNIFSLVEWETRVFSKEQAKFERNSKAFSEIYSIFNFPKPSKIKFISTPSLGVLNPVFSKVKSFFNEGMDRFNERQRNRNWKMVSLNIPKKSILKPSPNFRPYVTFPFEGAKLYSLSGDVAFRGSSYMYQKPALSYSYYP